MKKWSKIQSKSGTESMPLTGYCGKQLLPLGCNWMFFNCVALVLNKSVLLTNSRFRCVRCSDACMCPLLYCPTNCSDVGWLFVQLKLTNNKMKERQNDNKLDIAGVLWFGRLIEWNGKSVNSHAVMCTTEYMLVHNKRLWELLVHSSIWLAAMSQWIQVHL